MKKQTIIEEHNFAFVCRIAVPKCWSKLENVSSLCNSEDIGGGGKLSHIAPLSPTYLYKRDVIGDEGAHKMRCFLQALHCLGVIDVADLRLIWNENRELYLKLLKYTDTPAHQAPISISSKATSDISLTYTPIQDPSHILFEHPLYISTIKCCAKFYFDSKSPSFSFASRTRAAESRSRLRIESGRFLVLYAHLESTFGSIRGRKLHWACNWWNPLFGLAP